MEVGVFNPMARMDPPVYQVSDSDDNRTAMTRRCDAKPKQLLVWSISCEGPQELVEEAT